MHRVVRVCLLLLVASQGTWLTGCGEDPQVMADEDSTPARKPGRLAKERSPYLRQHQFNPVDWYPWGDEAFAKARKEDKPVLLSVGYAACHWCHVMEHESFEHAETAALMNDVFVCVKVDREERPDVDSIYMNAVQLVSGRGGWPMTVLLFPDGRPFWAGTYLPRPSVQALVQRVATLWKTERLKLDAQATQIKERLAAMGDGPDLPHTDGSDRGLLGQMRQGLAARFDARHGGYGDRPKFPPHTELLFLLDGTRTGEGTSRLPPEERAQVAKTLAAMAAGGVHDQIGGGFHRYSTDARWHLPHFEKMLYDNALLLQVYATWFKVTGDERWRRVADGLVAWLDREMARPGGGYASSLDADTDGEEGLTYTWTPEELVEVLGPEDGARAARAYGVVPGGNFHDEATRETTGRSLLHRTAPLATLAEGGDLTAEVWGERLDAWRTALMDARTKRVQPGLDDKVITSWNGLLVSGFVRAGVDLGRPAYLEKAKALASWLLQASVAEDGLLLRFPRTSGPRIPGFCADHVHLLTGLLDLAEATGDDAWWTQAEALATRLLKQFEDKTVGGFWSTAEGVHETLITRTKTSWDSPIPSDNGAAAHALYRLFAKTESATYRDAADRTLAAYRPLLGQPRMAGMAAAFFRALRLRVELAAAGRVGAGFGDLMRRGDVVRGEVYLERVVCTPGQQVRLVAAITPDAGWMLGAPGDGPTGTALMLADAPNATFVQTSAPTPETKALPWAEGGTAQVLRGRAVFRGTLTLPEDVAPGDHTFLLTLRYQACDAAQCREATRLELPVTLKVASAAGERQHGTLFGG